MKHLLYVLAALAVVSVTAKEVKVSSFGFDPEDSTRFIQAAIDSGARRVIFDRMPSPWVSLPLKGASRQELFFEPGAELVAKRGAFMDKTDILISFTEAEDVSLVGYGACLRMHKSDYMKPPYAGSEWRHALSFLSCRRVRVEGLSIRDSGGDAIYIGRAKGCALRHCEDVTVRDVHCDGNNRQGISVISVRGLLVERCRLNNTSGRPPEAGIDFEPNGSLDSLERIVVRDCEIKGNKGDGIDLAFHQLRSTSRDLDILIERCTTDGNFRGFAFLQHITGGLTCVGGKVAVRDCVFRNAKFAGIEFHQKIPGSAYVSFENCRVENCCTANDGYPDVSFTSMKRSSPPPSAVDFGRLSVVSPVERNPLKFLYAGWNTQAVDSVKGVIVHRTPGGVRESVLDEAALAKLAPVRAPGPVHGPLGRTVVKVTDEAPGEMLDLTAFNLRGSIKYVFYASKAGVCRFRGKMLRLRRSKKAGDTITVVPVGGGEVLTCSVPTDTEDFSVTVPAAGLYEMTVPTARRTIFSLTGADVPVGVFLAGDDPQNIYYSAGALYFHVKEGCSFGLYVSGQSFSECVRAALIDPHGKTVWERDNILFPEMHRVRSAPGGLWKLETSCPSSRGFEDYAVDLIGTRPVFFLNPKRYWE